MKNLCIFLVNCKTYDEYCVASGQAFESEENRKPVAKCSLLFIPPWPGVKFTTIGNCSLYQRERVGCLLFITLVPKVLK